MMIDIFVDTMTITAGNTNGPVKVIKLNIEHFLRIKRENFILIKTIKGNSAW